jgi:hypothetical protein
MSAAEGKHLLREVATAAETLKPLELEAAAV